MAQIEKIVQLRLRKIEFNLVEGFERVAEVDKNQVAFVAELGEERRLNGRVRLCVSAFQALKHGDRFGDDLLAFALRAAAPGLPIEAKKLVEQERTFKG
jgi:phage shock protein A